MQITRKLAGVGSCNDSTCPGVWETDQPGIVAVQGTVITSPDGIPGEVPAHEGLVLVPRAVLDQLDGR